MRGLTFELLETNTCDHEKKLVPTALLRHCGDASCRMFAGCGRCAGRSDGRRCALVVGPRRRRGLHRQRRAVGPLRSARRRGLFGLGQTAPGDAARMDVAAFHPGDERDQVPHDRRAVRPCAQHGRPAHDPGLLQHARRDGAARRLGRRAGRLAAADRGRGTDRLLRRAGALSGGGLRLQLHPLL